MEISRTVYSDAYASYDVVYTPDIVFARRETGELRLQLLSPIEPDLPKPRHPLFAKTDRVRETRRFPLVVDIPGSGWSGTEGYAHVPKTAALAKQGFVVACVAYRGTFQDDVRFPAAVQDVREAVRFLCANAEVFHVDPQRVALLGDSSGGHTAAIAALGNDPRFDFGDSLTQPYNVKACVLFYAPLDLPNLVSDRLSERKKLRPGEGDFPFEAREIYKDDFLADPQRMLAEASPIAYLQSGDKPPPFLLINGDEDPIIPMAQATRFCDRARQCGGKAELIKVAAGGHGAGCWSEEIIRIVLQFLKNYV